MESDTNDTEPNTGDDDDNIYQEQVAAQNTSESNICQPIPKSEDTTSTVIENYSSVIETINHNSNISTTSLWNGNVHTSMPITCSPIPSTSCYVTSSKFLHLRTASIELPTLFQLCVTQLNENSISISEFKNVYSARRRLDSPSNHLMCKVNNVGAKDTGFSTPDSLTSAPPSYSFVLRQIDMRRRPRLMGTFIPSPSFIVKTPPPTYATAFDIYVDNPIPPPPRIYNYGFTSMPVVCPECGYSGMSLITSRVTICTHLCAAVLCVFCCWFCAPLPYVLRSCKNVYHYCRNCRTFLGMYCPTSPENVY